MKEGKSVVHYLQLAVLCLLLAAGGVGLGAQEPAPPLDVMPWPERVTPAAGRFDLDDSFTMGLTGFSGERLPPYAQRAMQRLADRTGIFFKTPEVRGGEEARTARMAIECRRQERLQVRMDESYRLEIAPGRITLAAETDIGAMRGLETFLQLLCADAGGYYFPGIVVADRPRFPWRGLLLDSCRHFLPVEVVKRNLDGMAMVKMNVLHWHLTENQGFRVESRIFPRLHLLGSDGLYYTQEQIRDIVRYAGMRGIRVMPEFDIPGHSTSWLVGYPELGSGKRSYRLDRNYGVMDPAFNPAQNKTYRFFKRFFAEMSLLFPDEYFHIGGDEVNGKEWDANDEIQAFKRKKGLADNHALQKYFNGKIMAILKKLGKKMVGWDEILVAGLDRGAVIHSWRGKEGLLDAARQGHQTLLSSGYYIDLLQPTAFHYGNDPLPAGMALTPDEQARILGGEATMWSELVTVETVDSRIWPRTAAIAERLWSQESVADVEEMFRRLDRISVRLEEVGLQHLKNRGMLLRRMTGGADPAPLQTLLGLVEPVKGYRRHELGKTYTFFSPYTRLVDAAVVDPAASRDFEKKVRIFLENRQENTARELLDMLREWEKGLDLLPALSERSPVLAEIAPLAQSAREAIGIGREAVIRIVGHVNTPEAWLEQAKKSIADASLPRAELELRLVKAVGDLLDALAPLSRKEKEE